MNAVHDIWRQLVRRRLLPVAVILVAALVAVPLVLARDGGGAPAPDLKPVDDSAARATKTIVSLDTPDGGRHAASGASADPFAGEPRPRAKKSESSATSVTYTRQAEDAGKPSAPADGGSDGGVPSSTPVATPPTATPTTPAAPKPTYAAGDLSVRFGLATSGALERRTVSRLEALPSTDDAVIVYLGLRDKGKTALFMVSQGVTADGDGRCEGSEATCDTIALRPGETEFFDATDEQGTVTAQYQLDVLKIHG